MLDIRFVRENPDAVKENIRKKFQDAKLPLVDEVIALDAEYRAAIGEASDLRANRNKLSKQIGALMGQAKKDPSKAAEAEEIKKQVTAQADRLKELEAKETELQAKIQEIMYTIPQMIDPSVPIGPDDSHNVEVQRFGEPVVPDYPIPYHVDIMESFDGIDLDAAGRVSGNGFYYLLGDIARLHEAVLAYARDFMIDKGFTYVIPPFIRALAAYDIAALMDYGGLSLAEACERVVMEKLPALGGSGGLIAIDHEGNVALPFNTEGMYRAWGYAGDTPTTGIYREKGDTVATQ